MGEDSVYAGSNSDLGDRSFCGTNCSKPRESQKSNNLSMTVGTVSTKGVAYFCKRLKVRSEILSTGDIDALLLDNLTTI